VFPNLCAATWHPVCLDILNSNASLSVVKTVPWLRWLAACHPPRRPGFDPGSVRGGQSGTGTGFSLSTSVFPCQFDSTGAPSLGKGTKNNHHIHHRVVQEALKLRCARSVCCGALLHLKKISVVIYSVQPRFVITSLCVTVSFLNYCLWC
jgi:hypothetical protein